MSAPTTSQRTIDALRRGIRSMPDIRQWIEDLVERHAAAAAPVAARRVPRLGEYFSADLLAATRVVSVNRVPFPPLSTAYGLPELAELESMPFSAITWADMMFVHTSVMSEATYFHEMVHAVQWRVLGVDDYVMTCGVGLVELGYAQSPFEAFTYDMQHQFERGVALPDLEGTIRDHAIQTRAWAADYYRRSGVPIEP
jgi:hypothetical protein